MLFLGDIASPDEISSKQLQELLTRCPEVFSGKSLVCNLEGLISDKELKNHSTPILYNHTSIIDVLKTEGFKAVGLANNHTLDLPDAFDQTVSLLRTNHISFSGAGKTTDEAEKPAEFFADSKNVLFFNYAWHVLLQHKANPSEGIYVSTINEHRILANISKYRESHPDHSIVVYMHWNFDLETLPFPLHRKFSKDLIDAGANIVVGSHSHCVQGGERYKNGFIVYGLGNFFVPWYTYINGTIQFPEFARIEMVFEWDPQQNEARAHFFKYKNDQNSHSLDLISSTSFDNSEFLKEYSPYIGMSEKEYVSYFRINRRKKIFVPVYTDFNHRFRNNIKDFLIIYRMRFARFMAKHKLRSWNN